MKFPTIQTRNLNGDVQTLPADFSGQINLLFIAYDQWQQIEVNSWVPLAEELEKQFSTLRYYELPVVGSMNWFGQKQLDFLLRTGIRDVETRGRTLTLYIDQAGFRQQVGIESQQHIGILLLDEGNEIIWRSEGAHDPETAVSLQNSLKQATASHYLIMPLAAHGKCFRFNLQPSLRRETTAKRPPSRIKWQQVCQSH